MGTSKRPKATAKGTLETTPFAHLLQFVLSKELSGTLAIWPEEPENLAGQDRLLFKAGWPAAMRCVHESGDFREAFQSLFARTRGAYAFYEGKNLVGKGDGCLKGDGDPFALLLAGVRAHAGEPQVQSVLARLGSRRIQVRHDFPLDRLALSPTERAWAQELCDHPSKVSDAVNQSDLEPREAARVLYALTLLKGLESREPTDRGQEAARTSAHPSCMGDAREAGSHSRPPGGTHSRPPEGGPRRSAAPPLLPQRDLPSVPPPPSGLPEPTHSLWEEMVAYVRKLDDLNHFQLLGVQTQTTTPEVTAAYFSLVKQWHPERIPSELAPLRPYIREVFELMTEAHEVLSHDDQRAEYAKVVADGGGTRAADRMMAAVVEAAMDFQKAEVLLRRRNYTDAKTWVDRAIAGNPNEAGHYALRGWLTHLLRAGDDGQDKQILADIDRTLKDNGRDAKAHYYKAVVLKRRGDTDGALKHFRKVMELDPRHIEAQREVRLAQMRKGSHDQSKKPGGLLGKLFSKNQ